jgi:hypothetical protein
MAPVPAAPVVAVPAEPPLVGAAVGAVALGSDTPVADFGKLPVDLAEILQALLGGLGHLPIALVLTLVLGLVPGRRGLSHRRCRKQRGSQRGAQRGHGGACLVLVRHGATPLNSLRSVLGTAQPRQGCSVFLWNP